MFGPHLLVEGYGSPLRVLYDLDKIYNLIDRLPDLVGMTKITQTQAFKYHGKVPEDWGITAMVMIAESHISIHTFPEKNFFAFDLFSCRDFDHDLIIQTLKEDLQCDNIVFQLINRGEKFEHS